MLGTNEIGLWMACGGRESLLINASCFNKQTLLAQWLSPTEAFSHKVGLGVETQGVLLLLGSSKQQTNKQVRLGGAGLILNKEKVQRGGSLG